MPSIKTSSDFYTEVAKGRVPGHSAVRKFGHNPTTTAGDDIWAGLGVYAFFPATALPMEVLSTNDEDTLNGDGAWNIEFEYLDADWNVQTKTVDLAGQTPVALSVSAIRGYRIKVLQAGTVSGNTNLGIITVRAVGGATAAIVAELRV